MIIGAIDESQRKAARVVLVCNYYFPNYAKIVTPGCYAPIFVFEITTGL